MAGCPGELPGISHALGIIPVRSQKMSSYGIGMGDQTIYFKHTPRIVATSTIAGPKECEGIVGRYVETALADDMFGESTYEKAECKMLSTVIDGAITAGGLTRDRVDMLVSGDLLNQIISASFAARDFSVPFLGVYGACSTMAEALGGIHRRRLLQERRGRHGEPVCLRRAAIPLSARARLYPSSAGAVDGHRCGRGAPLGRGGGA